MSLPYQKGRPQLSGFGDVVPHRQTDPLGMTLTLKSCDELGLCPHLHLLICTVGTAAPTSRESGWCHTVSCHTIAYHTAWCQHTGGLYTGELDILLFKGRCQHGESHSSESGSLWEARNQDLQPELLFPEHRVFPEAKTPLCCPLRASPPPNNSHPSLCV